MSVKTYVNRDGIPPIPKGEWAWVVKEEGDDPYMLAYGCPCDTNCMEERTVHNCYIPVDRVKKQSGWLWDGNVESPTLSPSIQRRGECNWHGYLRNGKFVEV